MNENPYQSPADSEVEQRAPDVHPARSNLTAVLAFGFVLFIIAILVLAFM